MREISKKVVIVKNTRAMKGTKSYVKMYGKQSSTRMHIWVPIDSQLSEIMSLLESTKVELLPPNTQSKRSSIMGQYDTHEYTQL